MPCPFCGLSGGFHLEALHRALRALGTLFVVTHPGSNEAARLRAAGKLAEPDDAPPPTAPRRLAEDPDEDYRPPPPSRREVVVEPESRYL